MVGNWNKVNKTKYLNEVKPDIFDNNIPRHT